jgi:hypothetical protein
MPTITPIGAPAIAQPAGATAQGQSTRDAVVARLAATMEANAQPAQQIVRDQNRISPEEQGAVRQKDTNVETPTESVAAEETAPVKAEDPLSSQYAVFARKEKALRARDQQLRAREDALRAREAAMRPAATPTQPAIDTSKYVSRDDLTKNPLQVLSDMGLTYDQLTNLALQAPSEADMQRRSYEAKIEAELKSIKDAQQESKKFYEEQQNQSYQQAVRQMTVDATDLVNSDSQFEMIRETGQVGEVIKLIEKTFNEENLLLSVEEASKAVEDFLVEEATKLAKLDKIQRRLRPAQGQSSQQQPNKQAPTLKTLTNSVSSSRPLSAKERAILAFKGELK